MKELSVESRISQLVRNMAIRPKSDIPRNTVN